MDRIIRAQERRFNDLGWLKTYWLFSFSNYYDPDNLNFGPLRVFNDDVVAPGGGFPTHPHEEMEIVSIVLEGAMAHKDSMGNAGVIPAGDVQRMSAGTGLTHSEFTEGDAPVHFYQIWLTPNKRGVAPSYEQLSFTRDQWRNTLLPVASGQGIGGVHTNTDAAIYLSALDAGKEVALPAAAHAFVYVKQGRVMVKGHSLGAGDQGRLKLDGEHAVQALEGAEFTVICF